MAPAMVRLLAGVAVVLAGAALAHEHATGVAKQRMDLMEAMQKELKATAALLERGAPAAALQRHAEKIHELSGHIVHLFPPGSGTGVTDAAPTIWQRWPDFVARAEALHGAAGRLAAADATPLKPLYDDLAAACAACHKPFKLRR